MISKIEFEDIPVVAKVADEAMLSMGVIDKINRRHTIELVRQCYLSGLSFVAKQDGKVLGGIGAYITPNVFAPDEKEINLIAQWVCKEKRGSTLYYRLYKAFEQEADKLMSDGLADRIVAYHIPQHSGATMDRLGYRLATTTYVR